MAKNKPKNLLQQLGEGIRRLFMSPRERQFQSDLEGKTAYATSAGPTDKPVPGYRPKEEEEAPGPDPSSYFGQAADPDKPIETPDIPGVADEMLPDITEAGKAETERAEESLADTSAKVEEREGRMEEDITRGIRGAFRASDEIQDIAEQGRAGVEGLPDRVKEDIEGITNEYKQQTDVDIGKIESLGREAVGMAMDGKNAAAQAAVQAQQGATRNAIAQINADPSISPSRKTALIAQITTQSSMQIAATVGANIKDFTAMQTNAMTSTMNAVAGAMTARNQSLAALGGAEINAVASAHETAAGIMKGYDDLAANAIQGAEQLRFQYNQLRETSRAMNNEVDLQLLGEEFYVGGMPYDFKVMDYNFLKDAMGTDFSMQLQARGYANMEEAMKDGDAFAQQNMFWQMLSQFLPGPLAMIGSFIAPGMMGGMGK